MLARQLVVMSSQRTKEIQDYAEAIEAAAAAR